MASGQIRAERVRAARAARTFVHVDALRPLRLEPDSTVAQSVFAFRVVHAVEIAPALRGNVDLIKRNVTVISLSGALYV